MLCADCLLFEIELSRFGQCLNSKYSGTDYMQNLQILKINRFGTDSIFNIVEYGNNLNQVEVSAWRIMQAISSDWSSWLVSARCPGCFFLVLTGLGEMQASQRISTRKNVSIISHGKLM